MVARAVLELEAHRNLYNETVELILSTQGSTQESRKRLSDLAAKFQARRDSLMSVVERGRGHPAYPGMVASIV